MATLRWYLPILVALFGTLMLSFPAKAQLFDNLRALSDRIKVGDPRLVVENGEERFLNENPKGLAAGDFDGDGKADWAVSRMDGKIVIGWGRGDGKFETLAEVATPGESLRQLIAADLDGDARPDLAVAAPFEGKVFLLLNLGNRTWSPPQTIVTWQGARNLEALDFDGDGVTDLVIGGTDKDVSRNFQEPWLPPVPPIPPQATHGVVLYKGVGGGNFELRDNFAQLATRSEPPDDEEDSFPRPVYVLKKWRPPGQTQDWLLATHALENKVWILRPSPTNPESFSPRDAIYTDVAGVRTIGVGKVTSPNSGNGTDVVIASRDTGTVVVYTLNFSETGSLWEKRQQLDIPGGPRAVEIADLDADGWNEVVVVRRNRDQVIVLKNDNGVLREESESITGHSPRELDSADFDGDGQLDFVVLNRASADVSVLLAAAVDPQVPRTGFAALDQTYPVDGDVAQLGLHDLNGDGRDDVLQLHRSSAEVSVRLAEPQGKLSSATAFKMGERPSALTLADINHDNKLDLVTANLGDALGGLMVVRLGDGAGSFGAPQTFRPPSEPAIPAVGAVPGLVVNLPPGVVGPREFGALFAVLTADLDGDGHVDLIAGYYDCRIIFFKGDGQGQFTPTPGFSDHDLYFMTGYEARFIVAADFDQDGDQDLALAAWPGDVVVLENTGNFFLQRDPNDIPYIRHFFPRYNNQMSRARDIQIADVNTDGDPDLVVGTGMGTQILLGKPGIAFERKLYPPDPSDPELGDLPVVPNINFPVTAMITSDLDDDGSKDDIAAICADDGCLNILTANGDGGFTRVLVVEAPRTDFLAQGDVDGDGKTDLVGSGEVLWVALSSRHTALALPLVAATSRPKLPHVVINEIQPQNTSVSVPNPDSATLPSLGTPDWVELYNGASENVTLDGWTLELIKPDETNRFILPMGKTLAPGQHQIIRCARRTGDTQWTTGFRLPGDGGTLRLSNGNGGIVDEVVYVGMDENHSLARYSDADPAFRINHLPDPGRPNVDNGVIEPVATLNGISLPSLTPGQPLRFYATATDDIGLVGLTVHWRVRTPAGQPFQNALLFDDGMSGDGGRLDGVFSGIIDALLPAGTEIEFYLESEDLSGAKKFIPGQPSETSDEGIATELYTLRVPGASAPAGLEISEVLASNHSTIADDLGEYDDYVELRNVTGQIVSLHNLELVENLFGGSRRLKFNETLIANYPNDDITLAPGAHRLVFSDGDDFESPTIFHAPFELNAETGGEVFLVRRTAQGTQEVLDFSHFPVSPADVACARLGVGGRFFCLKPTPGGPNVEPGMLVPMRETREDGEHFLIGIPTRPGQPLGVEASDNLQSNQWIPLSPGVTGDGFERLIDDFVAGSRRFYRVRP
ncbi:MAG: FG-GAP-like repeat-containing protein [Verrucomicrobiales bacterium]